MPNNLRPLLLLCDAVSIPEEKNGGLKLLIHFLLWAACWDFAHKGESITLVAPNMVGQHHERTHHTIPLTGSTFLVCSVLHFGDLPLHTFLHTHRVKFSVGIKIYIFKYIVIHFDIFGTAAATQTTALRESVFCPIFGEPNH